MDDKDTFLSNLFIRVIGNLTDEQSRLEVLTWLTLIREVNGDDSLSTVDKTKRVYSLIDTRKTAKIVGNSVVHLLKHYKDADLPLSLKVALPATLVAVPFIGGQGAGIAALGTAIGIPALLLVFLGSAGITAILEAFLTKSESRDYLSFITALIARDEILRRTRKTLREAMAQPVKPFRFAVSREAETVQRQLLTMTPYDFERHVMSFFQEAGMLAWVTKQSNDAGVDGFARHTKGLILVQCKRQASINPVGRPIIQQFKGVIEENEAWKGYIVTTSRFTDHAIESAAKNDKVILVDMDVLTQWHLKGFSLEVKQSEIKPYEFRYFEGVQVMKPDSLPHWMTERLEKLERLKDKGFISEEDYQKQRVSVLSELR